MICAQKISAFDIADDGLIPIENHPTVFAETVNWILVAFTTQLTESDPEGVLYWQEVQGMEELVVTMGVVEPGIVDVPGIVVEVADVVWFPVGIGEVVVALGVLEGGVVDVNTRSHQ